MGIVLDEPPDPRQTCQRPRRLITVDDAEFSHTDRKLLVAAVSRVKDQTMAGTVHWLERPFFLFNIKKEHVILVVLPMTRGLPQFAVIHIGRNDYEAGISDDVT